MKTLLIILLISISLVSCASLNDHINYYDCDYTKSVEVVSDTVYVTETHTHIIYDCSKKRQENIDWIIIQ